MNRSYFNGHCLENKTLLEDFKMPLEIGLVGEYEMVVLESDTARVTGGESLPPVLSTPRMISRMEYTAHTSILSLLAAGQTSVGSLVNVRHLAATPVGMQVRFRSELLEIAGRRLRFKVEAWDAVEKIGEGEHERVIIDLARFTERLEKKLKPG
jgi:fluoroacetyl-CoA thioesterase